MFVCTIAICSEMYKSSNRDFEAVELPLQQEKSISVCILSRHIQQKYDKSQSPFTHMQQKFISSHSSSVSCLPISSFSQYVHSLIYLFRWISSMKHFHSVEPRITLPTILIQSKWHMSLRFGVAVHFSAYYFARA